MYKKIFSPRLYNTYDKEEWARNDTVAPLRRMQFLSSIQDNNDLARDLQTLKFMRSGDGRLPLLHSRQDVVVDVNQSHPQLAGTDQTAMIAALFNLCRRVKSLTICTSPLSLPQRFPDILSSIQLLELREVKFSVVHDLFSMATDYVPSLIRNLLQIKTLERLELEGIGMSHEHFAIDSEKIQSKAKHLILRDFCLQDTFIKDLLACFCDLSQITVSRTQQSCNPARSNWRCLYCGTGGDVVSYDKMLATNVNTSTLTIDDMRFSRDAARLVFDQSPSMSLSHDGFGKLEILTINYSAILPNIEQAKTSAPHQSFQPWWGRCDPKKPLLSAVPRSVGVLRLVHQNQRSMYPNVTSYHWCYWLWTIYGYIVTDCNAFGTAFTRSGHYRSPYKLELFQIPVLTEGSKSKGRNLVAGSGDCHLQQQAVWAPDADYN